MRLIILAILSTLVVGCANDPRSEFQIAYESCEKELALARQGKPSWRSLFGVPVYTDGHRALLGYSGRDINSLSQSELGSRMMACQQQTVLANREQRRQDAADWRWAARAAGFPVRRSYY